MCGVLAKVFKNGSSRGSSTHTGICYSGCSHTRGFPSDRHFLRLFETVVEATFGHVLSPNYEEVISQVGVYFTTIMSTLHISMTPKVHILLHHIPQFIRMTQMPLGLFSEEVVEKQHKRFLKCYRRYDVNCTYNSNFPHQFLNSVIHSNSYHI